MKTYHLQEKLSSKDIGVVKTALKNGKMVIGYLIPNSKNSDSRMGKQKFQFLKLTDTEADIIWLPPSHREPYPASEWRKIPKDKKAKLTVGGVFDSIKDPELIERVGFSDFEIVDPLDGDYDETGLMSRRVQKRHKRDLEETDQLNEIGDRPMNITNYDIDSTGQLSAQAVDKKLGIELNVRIGPAGVVEGKFTIVFEVNDRMDKTNEGNEIKVFSTVKHIVERWLADLDEDGISWSSIEFAASKDGSKKDVTSRERLYARFAKMIAKKYRGKLQTKQATQYHMNHELDQIYTKYIIKKNISESTEVQLNELLTMVNPEEWVDLQLRDQRGSMKNWNRERFIKVTNNFEMRKHISSFGFKATRELADEVMSIRDKKLKESVEEDIGLVALNNIKSRLEEKRKLVMLQRQKTVSKNHTKRVSKSVLECRAMRISKRTIIKEMLGEKDYQDLNAIQRKRVMERLKEKQYGVIQLAKSILPKLISSNQN